jgi:RNA polymerase sigma-70 factor (ECF subfamily)
MREEERKQVHPPEADADLIRAFQAGDKAAFEGLVLRHKDELFNLIYWFLGDYEEANDCAQDVFIKVYKGLKGFRFESAFATWLYRIAVNTCKNRFKSSAYRWRKKSIPMENSRGSEDRNPSLVVKNGSPSPLHELERKERSRLIHEAIRDLAEEQNRVIVLRDIQGRTYQEIAAITGLNLGTVKSRLARGRLELKKKLEGMI